MHIPTNSLRDSVSQNSWLNRQCFALKDNIFPPQSSQRHCLLTGLESSVYKYEQHTLPKLIPHLLALEATQIDHFGEPGQGFQDVPREGQQRAPQDVRQPGWKVQGQQCLEQGYNIIYSLFLIIFYWLKLRLYFGTFENLLISRWWGLSSMVLTTLAGDWDDEWF